LETTLCRVFQSIDNEKMADLLARFPLIDITAMGFYRNWKDECLWR